MVKMRQTNIARARSVHATTRLAMCLKAALGASALLIPMLIVAQQPAAASTAKDYRQCGERLNAAGISTEVAATACAEVLHPDDMGQCVLDIRTQQVDALTALAACRRVRRPLALSTCLQDIHRQDGAAVLTEVLEACRVSLLPKRYANCVVGLNESLKVPAATGLSTCLDASDRPVDVLSTFIPADQLPRMPGFGTPAPLDDVAPSSDSSLLETAPAFNIPPAGPQPGENVPQP